MLTFQLNVDIPINGAVFNLCNGETVTFTRIDHFTMTMTFDGSDGFRADAHDNIHVTASGNLGNSYVGTRRTIIHSMVASGWATFGSTFSEIREGAAPTSSQHILQNT